MTWVKLDDGFADHPKVAGLSDAAFRVLIRAIVVGDDVLTTSKVEPVIELQEAGWVWVDDEGWRHVITDPDIYKRMGTIPQGRTALYRWYDAHGVLLYVGVTCDVPRRNSEHAMGSVWWAQAVRQSIEWHDTRNLAEHAEWVAIREERPIYNIAGRPLCEER